MVVPDIMKYVFLPQGRYPEKFMLIFQLEVHQEVSGILVPDDWTLEPRAHYPPLARFDGANNRSSSERTVYYLHSGGLKDNIINTGTTSKLEPTKRLD